MPSLFVPFYSSNANSASLESLKASTLLLLWGSWLIGTLHGSYFYEWVEYVDIEVPLIADHSFASMYPDTLIVLDRFQEKPLASPSARTGVFWTPLNSKVLVVLVCKEGEVSGSDIEEEQYELNYTRSLCAVFACPEERHIILYASSKEHENEQ